MISIGTIKTCTKKGDSVTVYFKDGTSGDFIAENDLTSAKVGVIGNRAFTDAQPAVQLEIRDIFRSANAFEEETGECYSYFSVFVGSSTVQTLSTFPGQVRTRYNGTEFLVVQLEERIYLLTANLEYKGPSEFSGSLLYAIIGVPDNLVFLNFAYSVPDNSTGVSGVGSTSDVKHFDTSLWNIVHQGNIAWGFSKFKIPNVSISTYNQFLPRTTLDTGDAVLTHNLYPDARFGVHSKVDYGTWSFSASDTINTINAPYHSPINGLQLYEELTPGGFTTASATKSRSNNRYEWSPKEYEVYLYAGGGGGDYIESGSVFTKKDFEINHVYDFEHTGLSESSDGIERTYCKKSKGYYKESTTQSNSVNINSTSFLIYFFSNYPPIDGSGTGLEEWYHHTYIPKSTTTWLFISNGNSHSARYEETEKEELDTEAVVITDFLTLESRRYEKEYNKETSEDILTGYYRNHIPDNSSRVYSQNPSKAGFNYKVRGEWLFDPPEEYRLSIISSVVAVAAKDERGEDSKSSVLHREREELDEKDTIVSIINTGKLGIFRETIEHKTTGYFYDEDKSPVLTYVAFPNDSHYAPSPPQDLFFAYDEFFVRYGVDSSLGELIYNSEEYGHRSIDTDFYKFIYKGLSDPIIVKNPGLAFFARINFANTAKIHNHIITNGNGSPASFSIDVDFDYSNGISSREPNQYLEKAIYTLASYSNSSPSSRNITRGPFDPEDARAVDFPSQEFYIVTYIDSVQLFYLSRCTLKSFTHTDRDYPTSFLNSYRTYEKMTFTVHQAIALDSLTFIDKKGFEKSNTDNCFIFTPEGAAVFNFINERQCSFIEDEDTGRKFICASPEPLQNLWYNNHYSWLNLDLREERYNTLVFEIQGDRIKLLAIQNCENVTNFNLFREEHDWTQFLLETIPGPNDTIFNVLTPPI